MEPNGHVPFAGLPPGTSITIDSTKGPRRGRARRQGSSGPGRRPPQQRQTRVMCWEGLLDEVCSSRIKHSDCASDASGTHANRHIPPHGETRHDIQEEGLAQVTRTEGQVDTAATYEDACEQGAASLMQAQLELETPRNRAGVGTTWLFILVWHPTRQGMAAPRSYSARSHTREHRDTLLLWVGSKHMIHTTIRGANA
jgi:hypothetical protein